MSQSAIPRSRFAGSAALPLEVSFVGILASPHQKRPYPNFRRHQPDQTPLQRIIKRRAGEGLLSAVSSITTRPA